MNWYKIFSLFAILIAIFGFVGFRCSKASVSKLGTFNLDKSNLVILSCMNSTYNVLKKGINYEYQFDGSKIPDSANFCKSLFFVNRSLVGLALGRHIYYYNYEAQKIQKSIEIEGNTLATVKNDTGDLLIFSGGSLYGYDYAKDSLKKLKSYPPEEYEYNTYYPSLYVHPNKISYSKIRNSVFYSAFIDFKKRIPGIYELSLKDFSVKFVSEGFCPQFNDVQQCLYYINDHQNSIVKLELKDYKTEILLKYQYELRDMVVVDENTIFFIHASGQPTIKGTRFDTAKIYDKGEIKEITSKGSIYRSPIDVISK